MHTHVSLLAIHAHVSHMHSLMCLVRDGGLNGVQDRKEEEERMED